MLFLHPCGMDFKERRMEKRQEERNDFRNLLPLIRRRVLPLYKIREQKYGYSR